KCRSIHRDVFIIKIRGTDRRPAIIVSPHPIKKRNQKDRCGYPEQNRNQQIVLPGTTRRRNKTAYDQDKKYKKHNHVEWNRGILHRGLPRFIHRNKNLSVVPVSPTSVTKDQNAKNQADDPDQQDQYKQDVISGKMEHRHVL